MSAPEQNQTVHNARIRIVTRGDDAGSCHSANRAVREAVEQGILKNLSVMVPGPAFEEAAELLATLSGVDIGLHVTLNAEWATVKWGPTLPPEQVPSLVDADGYFTPTPKALFEQGVNLEEIMAEVEAQLQRARQFGLPISYLDEHMGVGWLPGLREQLRRFAEREGLLDVASIPFLSLSSGYGDDPKAALLTALDTLAPGTYVYVTHPGYDEADMQAFIHPGLEPGRVARERDAERRLLCDPEARRFCLDRKIEIVRYRELER